MRFARLMLLVFPAILLASCNKQSEPADTGVARKPGKQAGKKVQIGYVLHGLNDFTQVIKRGAEDAGKALGVDVEVTGPANFKATEGIGMFEAMIQKKKDGLVVVPMPGDVWVKPIQEASDAKIPVVTANITSPDSKSESWFGQDEYQSGVILAGEIKKQLEAQGTKSGKIVVGICAPGVGVLVDRYKGFQKGMEGTAYKIGEPQDVKTGNTDNYGQWENLATANPDTVAMIGLCSMDVPNLFKLKERSKAKWLIGGYDLNRETIDSIKSGTSQVTLGQHPYLQGYLPVLALVRYIRDNKPLPEGWVNVGTEVVTKQNVDSVYPRETDPAAETKWYAEYIQKNFTDMNPGAKPLPSKH